nr:phosphoribosylanthranilate isomerase [uncultured Methanoregula sp.]
MMKNCVQVAGIIDRREADLLTACGVEYLGFPLRLPVHTEDIADADAAEIIRSLAPPHKGVLITYLHTAKEIQALCHYLGAVHVQVHGDISLEEMRSLKEKNPDLQIIKSLVIRRDNAEALKKAVKMFSPYVLAFITDTYDPVSGASGATGKTHDWNISRSLVEISQRPVILAGGLNPGNVRQAIRHVQPAGVDVHTGVEDRWGRKDKNLVAAFVAEAQAGFEETAVL